MFQCSGWFGYEKGMNKKEFLKEKLMQLMFGWECHPYWYKIAHIIELFIMDAFVDLFITLCIVLNTVFMALDHADMSDGLAKTLKIGNYVSPRDAVYRVAQNKMSHQRKCNFSRLAVQVRYIE